MRVLSADGVELWWETEGEGPAVVLVPGRGDATDIFPTRFSDHLRYGGCRVLRYDPRDTGLSGDGPATSTLSDMAEDVAVVLGAAGVGEAHLVALSMGGLLAVDLAGRHPDLARSLTFLSAMSPDPDAGMGEDFFAEPGPDPVAATVRAMGDTTKVTRAWVTEQAARAARRAAPRPDAVERHQETAFRGGWPEPSALAEVHVPALVVHGDADRVLPLAHARSLAAGIEGAELVVVPGMGHLPLPAQWDELAVRVLSLVAAAEPPR